MRKESRLALILAALLLAPAYALPLWSIRIVAPQYNDGLGMFIGLRDIWGHQQHDIQNINILNHYIGMKPIDPAIVDVLTIMPWIVGFLMVSALLVAAIGRRALLAGWLVAFAGLGSAGLYEFWRWNHDYGHNLDPMAPIKIPGMSYQPPLLGTKQLLNMTTTSFPSWGTLFLVLGFGVALLALIHEYRPLHRTPLAQRARGFEGWGRLSTATGAALLVVLAAGCEARPATVEAQPAAEFAPGQPPCDYCEGNIPETRFGGQIETADGATYRFMSVECLAGFLLEQRVHPDEIATLKVVDYGHGERLTDARDAFYVRMQFEQSPSGLDLAAVSTDKVAGTLHYFHGGDRMDWTQVLDYVAREWNLPPATH